MEFLSLAMLCLVAYVAYIYYTVNKNSTIEKNNLKNEKVIEPVVEPVVDTVAKKPRVQRKPKLNVVK